MENSIVKHGEFSLNDINYLTTKLFKEYQELIEEGRNISKESNEKLAEIAQRKEELIKYENDTMRMIDDNTIISFNASGKLFSIKQKLLLKYTNTLFFELIASRAFDYSKDIFLDRPSKPFSYILSFYRNDSLPIWELNAFDLKEIMKESEYFQIDLLTEYIKACLSK